jgi:hypothetical protein
MPVKAHACGLRKIHGYHLGKAGVAASKVVKGELRLGHSHRFPVPLAGCLRPYRSAAGNS